MNKAGVINGVVHRAYPVPSRRGLLEIYLEADISRPHDWLKMEGKKERKGQGRCIADSHGFCRSDWRLDDQTTVL